MLSVFRCTTGAYSIMFYSNEIFTEGYTGYAAELEARIGTMMIGLALLFTSFLSTILLSKLGRRSILIIGHLGMLLTLIPLGIYTIYRMDSFIIAFTVLYILFFNSSIGTLSWICSAEILNESGMSFSTFVIWALIVLFSLFTNQAFKLLTPEGIYFVFGVFQFLSVLFCIFILKETKGLTRDQ